MKPAEVLQLVDDMRNRGVSSFTVGDVSVTFKEDAPRMWAQPGEIDEAMQELEAERSEAHTKLAQHRLLYHSS